MLEAITNRFGEVCPIGRSPGAPLVVRTGWVQDGERHSITVQFGLHKMRDAAPYFTLTIESGSINGEPCYWGADHETICRELPELEDLARLHLSNIHGEPMHAVANGWYWLAGACDLGERYHGGTGFVRRTADECLQVLADHLRISLEEANALRADVLSVQPIPRALRRERFDELVSAMRPRWKSEADAAIAKYGLPVFGDRWPPVEYGECNG